MAQAILEANPSLRGRTAVSNNAMQAALAKMPKMKINIPRPQHVKKGMHIKERVTINDYTIDVPCGVFCEVPEEVYLILVRAGKIQPQREEDMKEVPAFLTQEGPEYDHVAGGSGSVNNPISIN